MLMNGGWRQSSHVRSTKLIISHQTRCWMCGCLWTVEVGGGGWWQRLWASGRHKVRLGLSIRPFPPLITSERYRPPAGGRGGRGGTGVMVARAGSPVTKGQRWRDGQSWWGGVGQRWREDQSLWGGVGQRRWGGQSWWGWERDDGRIRVYGEVWGRDDWRVRVYDGEVGTEMMGGQSLWGGGTEMTGRSELMGRWERDDGKVRVYG